MREGDKEEQKEREKLVNRHSDNIRNSLDQFKDKDASEDDESDEEPSESAMEAKANPKVELTSVIAYHNFRQGDDINEDFKCSDLKTLEVPFWLTCLGCFCSYIAVVNSIFMGSSVL